MTYQVYPVIVDEGRCNLSREALEALWNRIMIEGKDEALFYDGSVRDEDGFLKFMTIAGNFPALVMDDQGKVVMLAWLNNYNQGSAQCHFCTLDHYRRGAAKALLDYWMSMEINGHRLISVLIGITPAPFVSAWKLAKCAGFTILGEVPNLCFMEYEQKRVPGVISFYARGGNGNGRR